jgi:hypothetical protein
MRRLSLVAASGQVVFEVEFPVRFQVGGPVTCLAVGGNTATINFQSTMDLAGFVITVLVVDGQPDTFAATPISRAPTDCSPPPALTGGPLSSGESSSSMLLRCRPSGTRASASRS